MYCSIDKNENEVQDPGSTLEEASHNSEHVINLECLVNNLRLQKGKQRPLNHDVI